MQPFNRHQGIRVKELAARLSVHLGELGYSESSLKTYGSLLSRFVEYCDENSIGEFTIQAGRDFIWERCGIVLGENDRGKNICRAIHMLSDFQRFGMVFKQHNIRREGFSPEYDPLFTDFLAILKKNGLADGTLQSYRGMLFRLEYYLKNRGVTCFGLLEQHHVNAYVESLAGYSQNKLSAELSLLKRLMGFAHENGYHNESFAQSLPAIRYKQTKRLPTTFTVEEVERIVANIDKGNPIGKRNYAVILLAAKLGLRVSDILNLTFKSIDWEGKRITIIQQKTGVPLDLHIPEDIGWAIIDYVKHGRPETACKNVFVRHCAPYDAMTPNFQKEIARAVQKAKVRVDPVKTIGMHTFRRSLATSMLDSGATLFEIAQVLGHAHPESAENYINVSENLLRQCALEVTF